MQVVFFTHSLVSDWNHGNAHFLRGIATELQGRGHDVRIYEPENGWSLSNLVREYGERPVFEFHRVFPGLRSSFYDLETFDIDRALDGADLVIVHEWNDLELVRRIGEHRKRYVRYRLLFHDTHHRSVTAPEEMAAYDLSGYDGVLAFGAVIRDIYLSRGWTGRAWIWHEAADTRIFRPPDEITGKEDMVWIGNWGDGERTSEYYEYLIGPIVALGLRASAYGVRYPQTAIDLLASADIRYNGWVPNYQVPRVFSQFRVTLHIPRRPYVHALPGIPTIRPFEALACGIPLICSPWNDSEHLFTPGEDFLVARNGEEMKRHIRLVLEEPGTANALTTRGRRTVLSRHTCFHRVNELLSICGELGIPVPKTEPRLIELPCGHPDEAVSAY